MRTDPMDHVDSKSIRIFKGWAENTKMALRKGKPVPPSSKFVLTSFVHKLCSIHRNRMLPDDSGKVICCENHQYLYIALRLCYDLRLKLRTKVSMLLREIFLCEESLEAIFSILTYYPRSISMKPGVNINMFTLYPRSQRFDRLAFEYFVKNICPIGRDVRETEELVYTPGNIMNTTICVSGKCTTPLLAATTLGDPDLVLLLLRHGADPLLREEGSMVDTFVRKSPVGFVVDSLNILALLKDSTWARGIGSTGDSYHAPHEENSLASLSYFTRAAYPVLDLRETTKNVDTSKPPEEKYSQGFFFEVHPKVTELVDMTSFRQPPSLCHVCRLVIRRAVTHAGKERIPTAIKALPVPGALQQFLDLRF